MESCICYIIRSGVVKWRGFALQEALSKKTATQIAASKNQQADRAKSTDFL
jgi:hypothetical protein